MCKKLPSDWPVGVEIAVRRKMVLLKKEVKKWQITQIVWRYVNSHTPQTLLHPFIYNNSDATHYEVCQDAHSGGLRKVQYTPKHTDGSEMEDGFHKKRSKVNGKYITNVKVY